MRSWSPAAWSATRRRLVQAALVGWTVSILPFLKYPANPPGVGEADTIAYRQALFFGFIALSIAGTVDATALHQRLTSLKATGAVARRFTAPALYLLYVAGIYLLMPPNPDRVQMPPALVRNFRAVSFAALALFWVLVGLAFDRLVRGQTSD
jgi:hypothetical protein